MFQKSKFAFFILTLFALSAAFAFAQENKDKQEKPKKQEKIDYKGGNLTAEQVAEAVILVYGQREGLKAVRKTELERGELSRFAPDGASVVEKSTYERRIIRGESLEKDRVRLDQKLSAAQYALIYDSNKIFGIINETVFVPREEAANAFQASIFHGLDTLLRYKENGSTLKLAGKDKQMGVEFYQLDVTDKQNRTTRFNISTKLFRVQSLEYNFSPTAGATPVKAVRKFYDYRNAQGTFVPWRSVLLMDGKPVEETNIATVTYGMKINESDFSSGE